MRGLRPRLGVAVSAIVLAALLQASRAEAAPVRIQAAESADRARIVFQWEEALVGAPIFEQTLKDNVLTLHFATAVELNVEDLIQDLPNFIASARITDNGHSLILALKREITPSMSRSYELTALDLVANGPPPAPIRSAQADAQEAKARAAAEAAALAREKARPKPVPVEISAGTIEGLTRITLDWPVKVNYEEKRDGDRLRLRFGLPAIVDLAPLRVDLPARVHRLSGANDDDRYTLELELDPNIVAKTFRDEKQIVIDLRDPPPPGKAADPPAAEKPPPKPEAKPPPPGPIALTIPQAEPDNSDLADPDSPNSPPPAPRINPLPKGGIVRVHARDGRDGLSLDTDWAAPAAAAIFRRGDAIFLLFGADAKFDFSDAAQLRRADRKLKLLSGDGVSGFAFLAAPEMRVSAKADGAHWRALISDHKAEAPAPAVGRREPGPDGRSRLRVLFPNVERVGWINDPFVGDRIVVAMATGPARGVFIERSILEAKLLPTAQGVAAEIYGDGLQAEASPSGMVIASGAATNLGDSAFIGSAIDLSENATPAFIDFDNWGGKEPFAPAFRRLTATAAQAEPNSPQARNALLITARFLVAHELGPEALGVLQLALRSDPQLADDRHFHALRGAANFMAGRLKEAKSDLSAGDLADDPNAALWRGLVAVEEGDWRQAERQFAAAGDAAEAYSPLWRARFRAAAAQAAIEQGDPQNASQLAQSALVAAPGDARVRQALVVKARADVETGAVDAGLSALEALTRDKDERISVLAELAYADLGLKAGRLTAEQAVERLEALRYRWRGDDYELEATEKLGAYYIAQNRWRDAFSAMEGAAVRGGDLPGARRLRAALADAFRQLFVEDAADKLEPIEALALFYQFKDLAPQGEEGDRAVRKLAARLVRFDLLGQAAELLQHQVDRRLQGLDEAQVATDLAGIYLLDREPEKALRALRETRQPRLPEPLRKERRVLEAAALAGLKRYDQAMELLENIDGPDAARLRADIAWRQQDWAAAAAALVKLLPPPGSALERDAQAQALRAAVAASLAGDKAFVDKLGKDYGAALASGPYSEAFAVLRQNPDRAGVGLREAAQKIADTSTLDGFLTALRRKFAPPNQS